VGARLPPQPIDGKDIWPLVAGEPGARSPQEAYYFYWGHELQAVRMGNWKLHFPHTYRTLAGRSGGMGGTPAPYEDAKIDLALYDLAADVGESRNVAARHPDIVKRIEELAEKMRAELGDSAAGRKGSGVREPGRLQPGDRRFWWVPGKPLEVRAR
jgi:arylsulfatase A-like enzyme